MIIIKMEQDKSLLVTRKPILHQFEHKADQLLFLIPPNIDNVDLANANVIARFILPSGMGMTKGLARKEELYQEYTQYVTSLTSVMTAEVGEIELCLSIVDKQGAVVLRSSPAFLRILPSISSDELLEEGQLDQLDWLTMQLARIETSVEETDAKKADNLIFDAETSTIQLTANGIPIGDRIYVCTDTGECITDIVINEEGEMTLRFSDGSEKNLGSVVDMSGAVYVPHIDDRKILTFTVEEKPGDIPGPVDLNPFDEWSDIDGSQVTSEITSGRNYSGYTLPKGALNSFIKEDKMANNVIFKVGTKAVYDALQQKDTNTLYWLTDVKEIRKGEELYAVGREATAAAAGLMSAADKAKLDGISSSGASAGLTPVDATIILGDGEDGFKTIQVGVSQDEGNLLEVRGDGLFVAVNQEAVEQAASQAAMDAVNAFAEEVSDDGMVNTFKELVDYVTSHAPEAADMAADIASAQSVIDSLPDEFISEVASVSRTETTNVAQLRLSIKQPDGTYSTSQEHGVLTLIPAGYGPDGVSGAGLMSLADKQKLDSIDVETIESLAQSLEWGTM